MSASGDSRTASKASKPPGTTVDSMTRSCFRNESRGPAKVRPPKGAKYKLTSGTHSVVLKHEFTALELSELTGKYELPHGISDAGTTHIRVHPACDYTFSVRRQLSEREIGDWGASLILTQALLDKHRADFTKGMRVLELGCGLGLPGLVCCALGADVLLSDRTDQDDRHHDIMKLVEDNIALNFMGPQKPPPGIGTGRVGSVEFIWSAANAKKLIAEHDHFDFLICADCVYEPLYGNEAGGNLAACFDILSGPQTECFIAVQRRPEDNVEGFLDLLKNTYHFLYEVSYHKHVCAATPQGARIELYTLRRMNTAEQFHLDVQASSYRSSYTLAEIAVEKNETLRKGTGKRAERERCESKTAVLEGIMADHKVDEADLIEVWRNPPQPTKFNSTRGK